MLASTAGAALCQVINSVFDRFASVVLLEKSLVDKVEEKKGAGGIGMTVNLHFYFETNFVQTTASLRLGA